MTQKEIEQKIKAGEVENVNDKKEVEIENNKKEVATDPFDRQDWTEINNKDGFIITVSLPGILAQTAGYYGCFFTAMFPFEVLKVSEVHTVAGSDAGAVTLDIEKLTGTQALGSGVSILNAPYDLKASGNTVFTKDAIDRLTDKRILSQGNRLALKIAGVLTSLQGVQVTLYCSPINRGGYQTWRNK